MRTKEQIAVSLSHVVEDVKTRIPRMGNLG
jgi:hypothetical protein